MSPSVTGCLTVSSASGRAREVMNAAGVVSAMSTRARLSRSSAGTLAEDPSALAAQRAWGAVVMATMDAEAPSGLRDPRRQEAAASACARYAEAAPTEAERSRHRRLAARYAALAMHLRRVVACGLEPLRAREDDASWRSHVHGAPTTGPSTPTRGRDRQPLPRSASPHLRACILLAAPGAPNRGTAAPAALVSTAPTA